MTTTSDLRKSRKQLHDRQRYLDRKEAAVHTAYLKWQVALHPDCEWCKFNLRLGKKNKNNK